MGFAEELLKYTNGEVFFDEPMKKHVSFGAGGNAKYFVSADGLKNLADIISLCKEYNEKYLILGNGSNLLFRDGGYNGVCISLSTLDGVYYKDGKILAYAGATLKKVSDFAQISELSGLEEFVGIPASVGGAVTMNAGAFGKSLSQLILNVVSVKDGKMIKRRCDECKFSYRQSIFQTVDETVAFVELDLKKDHAENIRKRAEDFLSKRKALQPSGKTCGSVFRNLSGEYAGSLIERAGLKGKRIGGAVVSDKHANFIINDENATATDIISLIKFIKNEVYKKFGITLKEELKIIGE